MLTQDEVDRLGEIASIWPFPEGTGIRLVAGPGPEDMELQAGNQAVLASLPITKHPADEDEMRAWVAAVATRLELRLLMVARPGLGFDGD